MKLYLVSALLLLSAASCSINGGKRITGNGSQSIDQRNFSNFDGIEISGPYDVILTQGPTFAVEVRGDENLLNYVTIENENGTLDISTKRGFNLKPRAGLEVYVTAPAIESMTINGSGSIKASTKIKANNLKIRIGGSGDVNLSNIDAPRINSSVAGSGAVVLKGATENFEASIAGSGDVHAFGLMSENTAVEIAGSGNAEVFASKKLKVSIAGSGDVAYKGNPATVNQSKAGSGSVRKS